MVTTLERQQVDDVLERQTNNVFKFGLLLTIVSTLVVIVTMAFQYATGKNHYPWVTAVGVVGGVIGMILARAKRPFFATMVMVISLFMIAAFYVLFIESLGTLMTIILLVISLGIIAQTVPQGRIGWSMAVFIVLGFILILVDRFLPREKTSLPSHSETIIVVAAIVTILAIAIIVFRQFSTFSLREKLISATLAVAIIAVLALAVGVNILTKNAITNEVGSNLRILSESQSLAIGEFLARKINTLEALSTNTIIIETAQAKNASYDNADASPSEQIAQVAAQWPQMTVDDDFVKDILEGDVAVELEQYQTLFPENTQLIVTDKYGGQIGATQHTQDYYKGDEAWWQSTYVKGFGQVYITPPTYNSENDTYSITIGVPIHGKKADKSGEIVGILKAEVSLNALSDLLFNARFGETGHIEIFLAGDRHLIVDDKGEISITDSPLNADAIAYIKTPEEPFIITDFDRTSQFLSSAFVNTLTHEPAVDRLGWIILGRQQSDEILAPVEQQQNINTILGFIAIVSAGVVAAYMGQRISQPISNLTHVALEVAEGNLDVQAPIETQDEIGILASSFNEMTGQLRESILTLEQRVQNRTQALATTVNVGQQLSTILDEEELITAVVNQVRESFDYYQVQIYLLDEDQETLILSAGTGQASKQMIADGHKLQIGQGLIGQAAATNIAAIVSDTTKAADWLPNPLSPDTKSETAVPIAIGDEILGVLDVQHNMVNGLKQEDADLLRSVANQVAVSLRNARLYKKTQQQAQREALLRNINEKITSTTNMETAMKVAVRELGSALGTKQTIVRLKQNHKNKGKNTSLT